MLKKMFILVLALSMLFCLEACSNKYPKELVGKYYHVYGVSPDGELYKDYRGSMTLYSNGKAYIGNQVGNSGEGKWWVENNIIHFEFPFVNEKYDLGIAKEDIEYELEHEYKDLIPTEKSEMRMNFKFKCRSIYIKYE